MARYYNDNNLFNCIDSSNYASDKYNNFEYKEKSYNNDDMRINKDPREIEGFQDMPYDDIVIYTARHEKDDFVATQKAIEELYPNIYAHIDDINNNQYFFNYNMFIARREVADCYCEFLFSILENVYNETDGIYRNDRYMFL